VKITRIGVWQLDLPLHKPYYLSGGRLKFERLNSTFVRIETDAGIDGWGEGCPWGNTYLPGHPYIKSALDIACWDISAKSAGLPVCELLGAREPAPVPIASSVSTGPPQEMTAGVQRFRDRGYRVHSCKVGADVGLDIERIRHLAGIESDGETIFYDANRAWLPREAITVMNAVQGVTSWFEQPCETLEQIRQVRRLTSQAISVDESLHSYNDLVRIQAEGIAVVTMHS